MWPEKLTDRAARTACERRDINGLRKIADALEARERDRNRLPEEQETAGRLAALIRKIERRTGQALIEQSRTLEQESRPAA